MSRARPPISVRRRTALAVLASAAGTALLFARSWSGNLERLLDLPFRRYGTVLTVLDGELYYREHRPTTVGLVVRAVPVRGGTPRLVLRDPTALPNVDEVRVTRQGIYYRYRELLPSSGAESPEAPAGTESSGSRPPLTRPPDPIDARRDSAAGPVTPPASRRIWIQLPRMHLRYAPLNGEAPRELLKEVRAVDLRVSGDYCYWLRSRLIGPRPPVLAPSDPLPVTELMASPLRGGEARRIALGVDTLWAGSDGAFWPVGQGSRRCLIHTYPPDFPLQVLDGFTGLEPPLQLDGRLYWLASAYRAQPGLTPPLHQVVTSLPDGTDFRVVLDVDPLRRGAGVVQTLRSYRSDLLFFRERRSEDRRPASLALCRLRLSAGKTQELSPPMTNVTNTCWLDGRYAYFLRSENRENWLDWSTNGLSPRRVMVLHRVPLDD